MTDLPESADSSTGADLGSLLGGLDMNSLLGMAQNLQEQLSTAQGQIAETEVTGSAGGGKVTITMAGDGEPRAVKIAPELVDPAEVDLLEDLILAALRDATAQVRGLQASMSPMGDLGGLMGGG